MKKFLVSVVAGVAVFGSVTAFAATLNVTSGGLGAGNASVSACNTAANVSYTGGFNTTTHAYDVATVTVTSAAGCSGKTYQVTFMDNSNAVLGTEVTGTLDSSGADTKTVAAGVSAVSLKNVAVVITG